MKAHQRLRWAVQTRNEALAPSPPEAEDQSNTSEDGLTVYLKQMATFPMLSRRQEQELVAQLDLARRRYRHAALANWSVLNRVVETYDQVRRGGQALDRVIDVMPSQGLTVESVRKQVSRNLGSLRRLVLELALAFEKMLSARTKRQRSAQRRAWQVRMRKGVRLAEGFSPRTELLESWAQDSKRKSAQLQELAQELEVPARSAAARAMQTKGIKELRCLMKEARSTPEDLHRWVRVLDRRHDRYHQIRQELVAANLRLVVSVAKRYRGQGLPFADLIQEGNRGLMRAADKFDYRLGWKFGTYAVWWIRQGVTRALSDTSRMVRIPCHRVDMVRAIEQVQADFRIQQHREPTAEEIAEELKVKAPEIRSLLAFGRQLVSIDNYFSEGDDDNFHNILADPDVADPSETADRLLLKDRVAELLRCLAPRDRQVIEMRYGLCDGTPRTLDEIARLYGLTRERIRQIESRGLQKLRQPLHRDHSGEFVANN